MIVRSKKIVLAVALALMLTLTVALLLTACGESTTTQKSEKSLRSIEVAISSETLNVENGVIIMTEGDVKSLAKGDFTVKAVYSDGSKKAVTDFSIDASAITAAAGVGSYSVTVTYKGQTETVQVEVRAAQAEKLQSFGFDDFYSFEYTGEEINLVYEILKVRSWDIYERMFLEGKVLYDENQAYTHAATEVGSYTMKINAAEGYAWIDEDGTVTTDVFVNWEITKKVIPMPTAIEGEEYVYDGTEKVLSINFNGQDEALFTFVDGGSDTHKGVDAGTYYCRVQLTEEAKQNYAYRDVDGSVTSDGAVEVATWEIKKRALYTPIVYGLEADQNRFFHYAYTGESILPELTAGGTPLSKELAADGRAVYTDETKAVWPEGVVTVYIDSSDVTSVDAGSGSSWEEVNGESVAYHRVFASINPEYQNNYIWNRGESSEYQIKFVIDKARASLPADFAEKFKLQYIYNAQEDLIAGWNLQISPNDYLKLLQDGTFDGSEHGLKSSRFVMSEEVKQYLAENEIAIYENVNLPLDENMQPIGFVGNNYEFRWAQDASFGDDNIAKIGTHTLKLVYTKGVTDFVEGNYEPIEIDLDVEVIKGIGYCYENGSVSAERSDGVYSLIYSLDKEGKEMSFVVTANLSKEVADVRHTFSRTEEGEYVSTADTTQAGYYRSYIKFVYDDEKYNPVYGDSDGVYHLTDEVEYDWQIAKRDFGVNGSDAIIVNEEEGTVSYDAGAIYTDYFPEDAGENTIIEVPAVSTEIFVYYKATEEDDYAILSADAEGKYDLEPAGFYKVEVAISYDHNNYARYSDENVVKVWQK
ncbi:MAG: hypothetical protein IJ735_04040 [Clostridia bacterium]|nr:hypothetical protein [Clostridia bacterium]